MAITIFSVPSNFVKLARKYNCETTPVLKQIATANLGPVCRIAYDDDNAVQMQQFHDLHAELSAIGGKDIAAFKNWVRNRLPKRPVCAG